MVRVKAALLAILYCLGLLLLLGLGTWQVSRGLHKDNVLSLVKNKHKDYPVLTELPADHEALHYQKITVKGYWNTQHFFLLENRMHQSQLGYEVLVPVKLPNTQTLLVNRGWIANTQATQIPPPEETELTGTLYMPKIGYTIGESIQQDQLNTPLWPKNSLYMDLPAFSSALQQPLYPAILVLDENHKDSLTRIWKPVVIAPERHYAYALQWYGLAIVFIIFGVIWYRRSNSTIRTE